MDFLKRWFGGSSGGSAQEANKRLKFILIHDRTDISPQLLENLRKEMIAVLTKYMEIDESKIEMDLDQDQDQEKRTVALIANIPVLRIKRGGGDLARDGHEDRDSVPAGPAAPERTHTQNGPSGRGRRHR